MRKPTRIKFKVRFRIGNRLGAGSYYSLREVCVHLVDQFSLKEAEITDIISLQPGEVFSNCDIEILRAR